MKRSPLCQRDDGREIFFTARVDGRKYRFTLPRTFLDDACGGEADPAARTSWVEANMAGILGVLTARAGGSPVPEPFGGVVLEEVG